MLRLFVGLELSPQMRECLTCAQGGVEGAHWQRDDQLHLTLAFIGEVSPHALSEIEVALSSINFDPFDLTIADVGMFGKMEMPKNLWAGVEDETPLGHLHEKILNALERAGLKTDRRRYKPHVTLARFRRGSYARIGTWLAANGGLKSSTETIQHFTLFSSHLSSDGPSYVAEARFGYPTVDFAQEDEYVFG